MLTLKHEAFLAFIERLLHDREFSEWFASQPASALASHGLSSRDLHEVDDILGAERYEARLSRALRPTVALLIAMVDTESLPDPLDPVPDRFARLEEELRATRERVSDVRATTRPWWKFW